MRAFSNAVTHTASLIPEMCAARILLAALLTALGASCARDGGELPVPGLEATRWGMSEQQVLAAFGGTVKRRMATGGRTDHVIVERADQQFNFYFDPSGRMVGFTTFPDAPAALKSQVDQARTVFKSDPKILDGPSGSVEVLFRKGRLSARIRCYPVAAKARLDTQCREISVRYWVDASGR